MFNLDITCDKPFYLYSLLALLPAVWIFSFRSLAGLGNVRRMLAIVLRSIVLILFAGALSEIQLLRISDKVTVIYLLDQSESIPSPKRKLMMRYVVDAVKAQRDANREDRAGVIVFGRDAAIEVPPFDAMIPNVGNIETYLERTDATNLEAAMKLAQASFPEDSAKRVVIVTDGNENMGNARSTAAMLTDNGIGIDVVPVRLATRAEIAIEKISLPQDIRKGQPVEARVVLNNFLEDTGQEDGTVRGKLKITRHVGRKTDLIAEEDVELAPGKTVLKFEHMIERPEMYTYRAVFVPNDPNDDLMKQNNEATTFTYVRGTGRVLLIEDAQNPGQFTYMIERLRAMNLEVEVQNTQQLYSSLAELQAYDVVILANVPRSSGEDANSVASFSDDQIRMLVQNTELMGSGLIMMGGDTSFGAGGWANTELEKAMPVDFQITNAKIQAVGALVLMMHASEMPQGNHWQKVVAREAIKALGPMDYAGLLHWDNFGADSWLWGGRQGLIRVQGQRTMMLRQLNRMSPGDMPDFEPSMVMALKAFNSVRASIKHMIVISDGDPDPPFQTTVNRFAQAGIKVTTVAVGAHGTVGSTRLQTLSQQTGGNYYVVTNPKALPKIYQREARRVARPLIKDLDNVPPQMVYRHEILEGIDGPLPPLTGMVLTTVKEHALVETSLRSPIPSDRENSTVLSAWTYKNGRTVAFTTDAGARWANAWTDWPHYDKFFSQMVRWAMRPLNDDDNLTIATNVKDGKVKVVIRALDKDDAYLNFLSLDGSAVGPDLEPFSFQIRQEASGRYEAEFDASKAGSYHLTIARGDGKAPIRAGVNVPYSAEFRDRETNLALIESLARLTPDGGKQGKIIGQDLAKERLPELLAFNTFRHDLSKAMSSQDVWHLLLFCAAFVFFADVFVRRVAFSYEWIAPIVDWTKVHVFKRERPDDGDDRLERLRNRKAAIASQIDERRAATRFEPQADSLPEQDSVTPSVLDQTTGSARPPRPAETPLAPSEQEDDGSYTSRLLEAKRRAWEQKKKE